LFAGTTGEFCFAAPPIATGFFGPPTAFWAAAGCETANAPRTMARPITPAIAPFFMAASPVCCRQPEVGAIGLTISMATAPGAEMSTPAKNGPINAVTASAANGAGFDFGNVPG